MPSNVPISQAVSGIYRPMSMDFALDPFVIKQSSKFSPFRLVWTLQNRLIELRARRESLAPLPLEQTSIAHLRDDRGGALEDTSVTSVQLELLLAAQSEANKTNPDIAEIGSYRGATTAAFAGNTSGTVYAVDPFQGYGGSENDLAKFRERTGGLGNVTHIRKTSGAAAADIPAGAIGMTFIDGVHDFSNSWFDFCTWAPKVASGGMIAFHDVDDHPGVRLAVRNLVKKSKNYEVWAYCPNLIIFRKAGELVD